MQEVVRRSVQLLPLLSDFQADLDQLREIRNSLVHGGGRSGARDLFDSYIQATTLFLAELRVRPNDHFGHHAGFVDEAIRETARGTQEFVARRISAARQRFAKRFDQVDPAWKETVLEMTIGSYELDRLKHQLISCPACSTQVLVTGQVDPDYEFDEEWDDGELFVHARVDCGDGVPGRLGSVRPLHSEVR